MMKKFNVLFIVLIIIGIVTGIVLLRSKNEKITRTFEVHLHESVEKSETFQEELPVLKKEEILDQSAFQDLLDQEFKSLPTIDDLKNLTEEEVHFTPEAVKDAGGVIGLIQNEAENDPAKRASAMNFFKRCAEDQELVPAIRAVCLNKTLKLIPVWKIPVPLSDELISQEISDLAAKLP